MRSQGVIADMSPGFVRCWKMLARFDAPDFARRRSPLGPSRRRSVASIMEMGIMQCIIGPK